MQVPALPVDEGERLAALHSLCILDTPPEERFDRITRLARTLFRVPICMVSLVDAERQWFKSAQGLDLKETPRSHSFCGHAILGDHTLVVEDALEDPRFRDNPFVTGKARIRFYAGQPLKSYGGHRIGTLCLLDREPRHLDQQQIDAFVDLAAIVESEINLVAAAQLRESAFRAQELLRNFFTLSLDMLCIANFEGYFKRLNPAWSTTLGYDPEELYDKPFVEFVHPDDRDKTVRETERLRHGGVTVAFENRYRCRDGSYKNLLWSSASDLQERLFYAVARDITHIRRVEEDLRQAYHMVEEASHAKSRFLANMSHEFRTPLNSVIGFADVLMGAFAVPNPEQRTYLERIRTNGLHLLQLVNEILDLSKIEAGKLELQLQERSLAALVGDIVNDLQVQARTKGIVLQAELPPNLAPLRTDAHRLRQVLINLVGNAIKFTDHGHVTVRVRTDSDARTPQYLDVIDTGVGIPAAQLDAVFEAFRQVDGSPARKYQGTGLGLAICKSLVERMGYRITVASVLGEGSTFSIDFGART